MKDEAVCEEAIRFLRKSADHDGQNRSEAQEDLRFSHGDQWPAQMQSNRQREQRPWFVINEVDAYVRQICNEQRQQRPRIKVHGVNNSSDAKTAQVITGICRHIEELSDADHAYDTAFEFAVRIGWGYIRLKADYLSDKTYDQDIIIEPVFNPFSVYFDPASIAPDGADAKECLITDMIRKEEFERLYGDKADIAEFSQRATGDTTSDWQTKHEIRVAEFYKIRERKDKLIALEDDSLWWEDELPHEAMKRLGVGIKGDRQVWRRRLHWYKVTSKHVLESRELPGVFIPVIPVYGANLILDGKIRRFGMVRQAKDPQRMLNYWQTAVTESVAMAPKAKWLLAEGQDDDFQNEWKSANVSALPVLHYRTKDADGNMVGPPQRLQPEPPPEGAMMAAQAAHDNLQRVMGMFDPAMRTGGNMSGKALAAEQQQSDMSNFHFYDNLTRSIKQVGRVIMGWIPTYYGEKRTLRIIGEDGKPEIVALNSINETVGKIEHDMNNVAAYDVVMDTGPGYNSKRQEAAMFLEGSMAKNPQLWQQAGDLLFRNLDFPGAEIIADRLAAANPLAQIDDKSDVPPGAQMQIKQLQQQVQQMQQMLQMHGLEQKFRMGVEQMRQEGETQRTQMELGVRREELQTRVHDTNIRAQTARHDSAVKATTHIEAEKIKAAVHLIAEHLGLASDFAKLHSQERMADKQMESEVSAED